VLVPARAPALALGDSARRVFWAAAQIATLCAVLLEANQPSALAWKGPGLPPEWVWVLERHPEEVAALPGYVWLDTPGRAIHVWAAHLEFRG
jgi:hypothetical protein